MNVVGRTWPLLRDLLNLKGDGTPPKGAMMLSFLNSEKHQGWEGVVGECFFNRSNCRWYMHVTTNGICSKGGLTFA